MYQTLVKQYGKYRYRNCIWYCMQEVFIKECGCQDPGSPTINNTMRFCTTLNDLFSCVYPHFTSFFQQDLTEKCSYCKNECESEAYGFSPSYNEYPSEQYGNFLLRLNKIKANNITSFDQLKRNVLSLNIYYDDLQYMIVEELPSTDLLTLVSAIGGTMGLFLGMSFLSILELVEIAVEVIFLKVDT